MLEEILVLMELAKLNFAGIKNEPIEPFQTEFVSNININSLINIKESKEIANELAKLRVYAEIKRKNVDRLFDAYLKAYPKYEIKPEPVLIYSMMAQESDLYINAVSPVGAGGEVQLMPWTAKALGLNVFITSDFNNGWKNIKLRNEYWREIRIETNNLKYYINDFNKFKTKVELIESYQKGYLKCNEKIKKYFKNYKKEIQDSLKEIKKRTDNINYYFEVEKFDGRFTPKGTYKGVKMFFDLLNAPDILGDIRLALCIYNAGRENVKNKMKKNDPLEIPRYIDETFAYQNIIATNRIKLLNGLDKMIDSLRKLPYSSMNSNLLLYNLKKEEYEEKIK